MSKNLEHDEIERRFLVKFPKSWKDLSDLFDQLVDVKRISQTYLIPENEEPAARVRKTIQGLTGDTEIVYDYNQKRPMSTGVEKETEYEISKSKYEESLEKAYPGKHEVTKNRFVFKYKDQIFELDVFKGRLQGLAILELELDKKSQPIELPPFLEVIKEVTGDKSYNNFNLADQ